MDDSDTQESFVKEDSDLLLSSTYAKNIFIYLKEREVGMKGSENEQ